MAHLHDLALDNGHVEAAGNHPGLRRQVLQPHLGISQSLPKLLPIHGCPLVSLTLLGRSAGEVKPFQGFSHLNEHPYRPFYRFDL